MNLLPGTRLEHGLGLLREFAKARVAGALWKSFDEVTYRFWLNGESLGDKEHPHIDAAWVERLMKQPAMRYDTDLEQDAMAQTHLRMLGWSGLILSPIVRGKGTWLMFAARQKGQSAFYEEDLAAWVILTQQLVLQVELLGLLLSGDEMIGEDRVAHSHQGAVRPLIAKSALGREVEFDPAKRRLNGLGQVVSLTGMEARLLSALLEHRHKLVQYAFLVRLTYGYEVAEPEAGRIIRPILSRLRRKLMRFEGGGDWITSVRGTGLMLD